MNALLEVRVEVAENTRPGYECPAYAISHHAHGVTLQEDGTLLLSDAEDTICGEYPADDWVAFTVRKA